MGQVIPAKLVINGLGAVAGLGIVGWLTFSAVQSDQPTVCEGRYAVATRFALTSDDGKPVSLSELQARLGTTEYGLMQNGRILEPGANGRDPILAVSIGQESGAGYKDSEPPGGVGFIWQPADLSSNEPRSACLSYRVFLPEGFDYSAGGTLPGLLIGSAFAPRAEPVIGQGVAARLGWNREGRALVNTQFATDEGWKNPAALTTKTRIPVGRWVSVEQEVVLNDPGKKNGAVRLWVDGELVGENKKLGLRGDDTLTFAGVIADTHFGSISNDAKAVKDEEIHLSPFTVRWQ